MEDNTFVPHGDRRDHERRSEDPSIEHANDPMVEQERRSNADRRSVNDEEPELWYTLWH